MLPRWPLLTLVLLGVLATAQPAAAACDQAPGDRRIEGQLVRVPAELPARPALVLAFHGLGGTGEGLAAGLDLDDAATRHRFVVAYPKSRHRDWELNRKRGDHDLPMTRRLIDVVVRRLCLDPHRVYATGFSNGGSYAARVGCDLRSRIAAIAPVAGSFRAQAECPPSRGRMPTLEQHGVDQFLPTVPRLMRMTAARNRCPSGTESRRVGPAIHVLWRRCALERYWFPRLGHAWPAGASERIWRFFRRYRR